MVRFDREAAENALDQAAADGGNSPIFNRRSFEWSAYELLNIIQVVWNSQAEPSPASAPAPLEPGTPIAIREAVRLITGRYVVPDATGQWWELSTPHHFAMSSTPISKAGDELLRHLNVVDPLKREGSP